MSDDISHKEAERFMEIFNEMYLYGDKHFLKQLKDIYNSNREIYFDNRLKSLRGATYSMMFYNNDLMADILDDLIAFHAIDENNPEIAKPLYRLISFLKTVEG